MHKPTIHGGSLPECSSSFMRGLALPQAALGLLQTARRADTASSQSIKNPSPSRLRETGSVVCSFPPRSDIGSVGLRSSAIDLLPFVVWTVSTFVCPSFDLVSLRSPGSGDPPKERCAGGRVGAVSSTAPLHVGYRATSLNMFLLITKSSSTALDELCSGCRRRQ